MPILLLVAVVALTLAFAWKPLRFLLLSDFNTSRFNDQEISIGRRYVELGRPIVGAIRTYRTRHGSLPQRLEDLVPDGLANTTDLKDWGYTRHPTDAFTLHSWHPSRGSWMLYYEPAYGWLMAADPDTRPIGLGP